jgi:hypothetical protein
MIPDYLLALCDAETALETVTAALRARASIKEGSSK